MGSSKYSDTLFRASITNKVATGAEVFAYNAAVQSGEINVISPLVDPRRKNKAGEIIRESLDSVEHPLSRPVGVLFDVTGSMASVPRVFVNRLGALMGTITEKKFLQDPHVLFGSIGDATSDRFPLQVGQFEAGNEMDEALTSIILEGRGGGGYNESYELAMYFMARHTRLDCVDKRGERGFLFLIGDEMPYPTVRASHIEAFIGPQVGQVGDISLNDVLDELRAKFEVIWIMPAGTANYGNATINGRLRELFGQQFYKLENPADIANFIAGIIGISEGFDLTVVTDALGGDTSRINDALNNYSRNRRKVLDVSEGL